MRKLSGKLKHSFSYYLSLATLGLLLTAIFFTITHALEQQKVRSNASQVSQPDSLACIPSGQKCDATGAKKCCAACTKNSNPSLPNDPGTCD